MYGRRERTEDLADSEVSIFRSERMSFIQIYIPAEISRFVVNELGELGKIQFKDLNEDVNSFQRYFAGEIRRFDELERKLRFFNGEMEKFKVEANENINAAFARRSRRPQEIEEMEEVISNHESRLLQLGNSYSELEKKWIELVLQGHVIKEASNIFEQLSGRISMHEPRTRRRYGGGGGGGSNTAGRESTHVEQDVLLADLDPNRLRGRFSSDEEQESLLESNTILTHGQDVQVRADTGARRRSSGSMALLNRRNSIGSLEDLGDMSARMRAEGDEAGIEGGDGMGGMGRAIDDINVGFVAGVVRRERLVIMEKVLWRTLRGNIYMEFVDVKVQSHQQYLYGEKQGGEEERDMSVFVIFVHGQVMHERARRIANSFGARIYEINKNAQQRVNDYHEVVNRNREMKIIMEQNIQVQLEELYNISREIETWTVVARKEKAIYYAMNQFSYDEGRQVLIAEGWTPTRELGNVNAALRAAVEQADTNATAVMSELQTVMEPPTYLRTNKFTQGFQNLINSYGVPKYGEVNPGIFAVITFPFLFAVMFGDLGHGVMMAAAGLAMVMWEEKLGKIKSEEFSMVFSGRYMILLMGLFSTVVGFVYNDMFSLALNTFKSGWEVSQGQVKRVDGYVYPIGVDPAWHHADNGLLFLNSYKMKMSILLGVAHMLFGMAMQVYNSRHFHKPINIKHVFVPQIIYFMSIFGYLCFTILYKWSINWYAVDKHGNSIYNSPPSLLNMLIYMFLNPGVVDPKDELYPGQANVQLLLLMVAGCCVPWMLLAKPLILRAEHKRIVESGYGVLGGVNQESMGGRLSMVDDDESETGISGENVLVTANRRADDSCSSFGDEISSLELGAANGNNENNGNGNSNLNGNLSGNGGVHSEQEFSFGDVMMDSIIHTIEFCLSGISHTASYLRLWALSLAHAQLSQVLWSMTIEKTFGAGASGGIFGMVGMVIGFSMWLTLTISILMVMEGLSAFLHALRLHWVEFNSKFYEGSGEMFEPFKLF